MVNFLFSKLNFNESWAKDVLEQEFGRCENIVVIPFSYWDSEVYDCDSWERVYGIEGKYFNEIFIPFSTYGFCKENFKYINFFTDSESAIKDALSWADVLFLPGGAPDLFMERIVKKGIKEPLRSYSGVVLGCSAGSMIQFEKFHITPRQFYPNYEVISGVGMIDKKMGIEVHYEENSEQLKSLEMAAAEYSSILLLDNKSGAMIKEDKVTLLGNAQMIEF